MEIPSSQALLPPRRVFQLVVRSIMTDALEFGVPFFPESEGKVLAAVSPVMSTCAFDVADRIFRVDVTCGDAKVLSVVLDPVQFTNFDVVSQFLRRFWARSVPGKPPHPMRVFVTSACSKVLSTPLLLTIVSKMRFTFYAFAGFSEPYSESVHAKIRALPDSPSTFVFDTKIQFPKPVPTAGLSQPILQIWSVIVREWPLDSKSKVWVRVEHLPSFLGICEDQANPGEVPVRCFEDAFSHVSDRTLTPSAIVRVPEPLLLFENVNRGHRLVAKFEKLEVPRGETFETALDNLHIFDSSSTRSTVLSGLVRISGCAM